MADNQDLTLKVGADTTEAENSLKKFSSDIGQNVIALNQGLELAGKLVSTIGKAFEKAFDMALAGEQIDAINIRFKAIADQAGLIPEQISKGIEDAVHGTVDMEDALKAASNSMMTLGENANRIPEMFELAKKAAMATGQDVVDVFERISMAAATGSTRALRDINLIVNAEDAYKKYGEKVGVAANNLSEAQRQQAILNAVLEKGNTQFKNITGSITPLTEASKQFKVALNEIGDSISLVISRKLGPSLAALTSSFAGAFNNAAQKIKEVFLGELPPVEEQIKRIKTQIKDIEMLKSFDPGLYQARQLELSQLKEQLAIQEQLKLKEDDKKAGSQNEIDNYNAKGNAIEKTNEQRKEELDLLRSAQEEYEKIAANAPTMDNFFAGMSEQMTDMAGTVRSLGKAVASTLVTGFTNAFASMGKALATGGNALDAFAKQALSTIGAIAIQIGQFLILAGLGFSALPGFFSAGGAIAAGLALVVLGGFLQGLGGGSAGANDTAMSGGGIGETAGTSTDLTTDQERETPQTGVQVIVQGNILNSRDSALEIANVLNDAFDMSGTIVRANA